MAFPMRMGHIPPMAEQKRPRLTRKRERGQRDAEEGVRAAQFDLAKILAKADPTSAAQKQARN